VIKINEQDIPSHGSRFVNDGRPRKDHVWNNLGAIEFNELQLVEVIGGSRFGKAWSTVWRSTPVAVKVMTGSAQMQKVPRAVLEAFAAKNQPPRRHATSQYMFIYGGLFATAQSRHCHGISRERIVVGCHEADTETALQGSGTGRYIRRSVASHFVPTQSAPRGYSRSCSTGQRTASSERKSCVHVDSCRYLALGLSEMGCLYGMEYGLFAQWRTTHLTSGFLDESYDPKVCDFGLSRLQAAAGIMTGNCGTVQWMAPEVLANQKYNKKVDVFSYGIILWELLTRACPYEGVDAVQCALAVLNRAHRPSIPTWCPPILHALIRACLKTNPRERPTFAQIVVALVTMP
jgi:hypothetical protein